MGRKRKALNYEYIACEEMNFLWSMEQVNQFDEMWEQGHCINKMSKALNRDADEIFILALDRANKNKIKERDTSILGNLNLKKGDKYEIS